MSLGHNTVRLPLLAAVVLLASSCSVARRVQTARSVELRAEITQMPTVAELDVAPVRVEVDTTWTNHLFKGSTPVEAQREALVARALAGGSADLLVEPKVRHEANRHWFRTEHRLTVSGYPARYERFRSATFEDIRTINAVRCPDTVRTTLVLAETLRPTPRKGASLGRAVSVTTPKPVRAKGGKFRERRSGYRGLVEGSYINLTTSSDFRGDGFAFSTIHGRQCGKHFFVHAFTAQIVNCQIRVLYHIVQESGLDFSVIAAHKPYGNRVQDSRLAVQVFLPLVRIKRNLQCFFYRHNCLSAIIVVFQMIITKID